MSKKSKKTSFALMNPKEQDELLGILDRQVQMILSHHLEHNPYFALLLFVSPDNPGIVTNADNRVLVPALRAALNEEQIKR